MASVESSEVTWQPTTVSSPHIKDPVPVIAARDIKYVPDGHRFQTVTVYIPKNDTNAALINQKASSIPSSDLTTALPRIHVHIHGGAWRDPFLSSRSIEAAVAHAFSTPQTQIAAIIGVNYTISPFPTHPQAPYDPWQDNDPSRIKIPQAERDLAREARHPMHIRDALLAFKLLRSMGLRDGQYILSGHSCGACICFQSILQPPEYWGLAGLPAPPRPAALVGLNGLYDLPALVYDLGPSHEHMSADYQHFQGIAFGADESRWQKFSPAQFEAVDMRGRLEKGEGSVPKVVLVDQSTEDQLVPFNQMERMRERLRQVDGMMVITGSRCHGKHAAPWEEGKMIWDTVNDVLWVLAKGMS